MDDSGVTWQWRNGEENDNRQNNGVKEIEHGSNHGGIGM
jgi:hypothetical protein